MLRATGNETSRTLTSILLRPPSEDIVVGRAPLVVVIITFLSHQFRVLSIGETLGRTIFLFLHHDFGLLLGSVARDWALPRNVKMIFI